MTTFHFLWSTMRCLFQRALMFCIHLMMHVLLQCLLAQWSRRYFSGFTWLSVCQNNQIPFFLPLEDCPEVHFGKGRQLARKCRDFVFCSHSLCGVLGVEGTALSVSQSFLLLTWTEQLGAECYPMPQVKCLCFCSVQLNCACWCWWLAVLK